MGIRGRKPKPLALRRLEGNPGKRPLVKKIPKSGVNKFSGGKPQPRRRKPVLGLRAAAGQKKGPEATQGAKRGVPLDTPQCPGWLTRAAKREWHRIAPALKKMGILTVIDRTALAGYCQSYARYVEAEKAVEQHGILMLTENGCVASPRVAVAQKYLQICKALCVEFGMTPSARGRMTFGGGDEKEDDFEKTLD